MKHPKRKSSGTAKREPRARTFTRCRTCRSRHPKCDEARPVCSSCRRLNLPCQGYTARLLWVSSNDGTDWEDKLNHRGTSFRYPLLTEDARSCPPATASSVDLYIGTLEPPQFDTFVTDMTQLMDFAAPTFDDLAQALSFDDFTRNITFSLPASPTRISPVRSPARSPSPRPAQQPSPTQAQLQSQEPPQRSTSAELISTIPPRVLPGADGSQADGVSTLPSYTAPLLRYLKDCVLAEPPGQESRNSLWKLLLHPLCAGDLCRTLAVEYHLPHAAEHP